MTTGRSFQSTPPRGGDGRPPALHVRAPKVSIHAPARGRRVHGSSSFQIRRFNPRPREGATGEFTAPCPFHQVSIHAPARGRRQPEDNPVSRPVFQSTPPRGGDRGKYTRWARPRGFNPRPREGATPANPGSPAPPFCFNPRPREGATIRAMAVADLFCVSIHAPARGRPFDGSTTTLLITFQSTPPRGGDRRRRWPRPGRGAVSIHAPARGRRRQVV